MQRICGIYFLLLISINMVLSETPPGCPLFAWQCNNGQCIKSEELCDGNYDCEDKSDETVDVCLLRPCPAYAFQCAYGACITGNFKCNGIVNCVDGSDENRFMCNPGLNYEKEMQGKCLFSSLMECNSGECISNELLCDGKADCKDGSDETVDVCSFFVCPKYSFRCGYGACIMGSASCNGVQNCVDGSDEIDSMCPNSTITTATTTTVEPPAETVTTTTNRPFTTTHSPTNETPSITYNSCSSSTILRGISSVATCYYQKKPVSCYQNIRVGTVANVSCTLGYTERQGKNSTSQTRCDRDGEWTRPKMTCIPECGTLSEEQKASASKPWDVTILRRSYSSLYEPKCSGVIVSPKIVLTAGNCFLNQTGGYNTDHIYYNLVPGYYNESYRDEDRIYADVHNISSINIKSMHRTEDLALLVIVNYFQFSNDLKPICLPNAISFPYSYYENLELNIGRPFARDTSKHFLENLISSLEIKENGRAAMTYVRTYYYSQFINKEIRKYDYIL